MGFKCVQREKGGKKRKNRQRAKEKLSKKKPHEVLNDQKSKKEKQKSTLNFKQMVLFLLQHFLVSKI